MLNSKAKSVILRVEHGKAICPVCNRETATRIRPDTTLTNFPLFCKLCKQTTLVAYREPEPESQSH